MSSTASNENIKILQEEDGDLADCLNHVFSSHIFMGSNLEEQLKQQPEKAINLGELTKKK